MDGDLLIRGSNEVFYDPFERPGIARSAPERMTRPCRAYEVILRLGDPECAQEFSSSIIYRYTPLANDSHIRLLHLLPGRGKTSIACNLFHIDRRSSKWRLYYEALSYTWGLKITHTVSCNGSALAISENLWLALQRLRYVDRERILWVDAICINQSDVMEKSKQVAQMRYIYQNATQIVVWLGEANHDTELAFKLILQINSLPSHELLNTKPATAKTLALNDLPPPESTRWQSLSRLCHRDWYFRAWILQEISVIQQATMVSGRHTLPFEYFERASRWIGKASLTSLTGVDATPLAHVVDIRSSELGRRKVQSFSYPWDTLNVLIRARSSCATEPKDKIFAILSLLDLEDHAEPLNIEPDYRKSTVELYTEFAIQYIQWTGALDFLSAVEDRTERLNLDLPSWVPDWEVRHPATPFLHGLQRYSEWREGRIDPSYASVDLMRHTLGVTGVIIDTCTDIISDDAVHVPMANMNELSTANLQHVIRAFEVATQEHKRLLHQLPTTYPTGEDKDKVYAKTILAGAWGFRPSPFEPTDHSHEATNHDLECPPALKRIDFGLNGEPQVVSCNTLSTGAFRRTVKYLEEYHQISSGRKLFITQKGNMGLCHRSVRRGDVVVLLSGGRTPFVLRQALRHNVYRFAGECYLHGCMWRSEQEVLRATALMGQWFEIE